MYHVSRDKGIQLGAFIFDIGTRQKRGYVVGGDISVNL